MPTVSYLTVGGETLAETRGGAERDYLPDPLGSVAALLDPSQARTDAFLYWPFGEERSRTGSTPTPFRFVGTLGYHRDGEGRTYVRARHHRPALARWQTLDPLWPGERAYGYAGGNPTSRVDPSGEGNPWDSAACQAAQAVALSMLSKCFDAKTAKTISVVMQCIAYGESGCDPTNQSQGPNGTVYGLYQLGDTELDRCCRSGCTRQYGRTQIGCNTSAAIGLMIRELRNPRRPATLGDRICPYWGVLPCPGEPGGPRPQGKQTVACLKAKGLDIFKIPAPTIKPGCDPCS